MPTWPFAGLSTPFPHSLIIADDMPLASLSSEERPVSFGIIGANTAARAANAFTSSRRRLNGKQLNKQYSVNRTNARVKESRIA